MKLRAEEKKRSPENLAWMKENECKCVTQLMRNEECWPGLADWQLGQTDELNHDRKKGKEKEKQKRQSFSSAKT